MEVKLVSITPEAEQLIAYCARVSNPSNQDNDATAPKLLKYLINHKHWSPLEMAHAVIEINAPRDITRQIIRHGKGFSFQEFSTRYARVTEFTDRECRMQDTANRQNSLPTDDFSIKLEWENIQRRVKSITKWSYDHALELGIAKEVARTVLPEGFTMSRIYMAGVIRSWVHYYMARSGPDTQKEHRDVAKQCWEIICKELPSLEGLV